MMFDNVAGKRRGLADPLEKNVPRVCYFLMRLMNSRIALLAAPSLIKSIAPIANWMYVASVTKSLNGSGIIARISCNKIPTSFLSIFAKFPVDSEYYTLFEIICNIKILISQKDFAIILSILNPNGGMIVKRTYDMKVAFYVSREQKDRFDYINARKDIDFSSKLRELMADYILENEHLLPDDLKFKPTESTE